MKVNETNESCLIIHPDTHSTTDISIQRSPKDQLEECIGLAQSINLIIIKAQIIKIRDLKSGTLIGKGGINEIKTLISSKHQQNITDSENNKNIELVILNTNLTPIQQRNLENSWEIKVIDRTGLILEIFGARAKTKEGRLQVGLAAMTYQRSRLVRSWTHLERQRGGAGFMGGPGEKQIETDRRLIDKKILKLKRELKTVVKTRELHRKSRRKVPYPIIALVGYTNAGKSTLFNTLTKANVVAKNQLFVTLDPTMRSLVLPSGRSVILSDTVGFISNLPHELVNAFQATLEEVREADLIIHVRDSSHSDSWFQNKDVLIVLDSLGISDRQNIIIIDVLNKIDLLHQKEITKLENLTRRSKGKLYLTSSINGYGTNKLLRALDNLVSTELETVTTKIKYQDGKKIAWLYKKGEVVKRIEHKESLELTVRLNKSDANRLDKIT